MNGIFLISQHVVGMGHLTRASALARAFASAGSGPVTLFSGGRPIPGYEPPPGVDFIQLPVIERVAVDGNEYRSVDPRMTLAEAEDRRAGMLVDAYRQCRPAALVTELYPFIPERMAGALEPLFDVIRRDPCRPLVLSSIRSLPLGPTQASAREVRRLLLERFDHVLHHTDPRIFPDEVLGDYVREALDGVPRTATGFVRGHPRAGPVGVHPGSGPLGLLLTVGGGRDGGARLCEWIAAARAATRDGLLPAVAVCGPLMPQPDRDRVHALAGPDVMVLDHVPGLDALISACRAVVCMGGYNTMSEAVSNGRPALVFPRQDTLEQEAQVRAFAGHGLVRSGEGLSGTREIAAAFESLLDFRPAWIPDYRGAAESAAIVTRLLRLHEGRASRV